jgi:Zn-dependent peptidase ImmA (M78 family)
MSNSKILKIYQLLTARLPNTYPHADLVIHSSVHKLRECYSKSEGEDGYPPYAFCDSDDNTIHVSAAFNDETARSISWYFLHEIGHLYALQRYGDQDIRWKDSKISERYANSFADRWVKKLEKEEWYNTI